MVTHAMLEQIWIVWEDSHGDVGYWTTEKGAYDECCKIINQGYDGDTSVMDNCVGMRSVPLNVRW